MNKRQVETKDDLELYYNNCRKIKFIENDPDDIHSIIRRLLDEREATVYTRNGFHCDSERYRSLDDIIKVSKFYFPKATVSEIVKAIVNYESGLSPTYLQFTYCPDIRKYNFQGLRYGTYGAFYRTSTSFGGQGFPNCRVKVSEFM